MREEFYLDLPAQPSIYSVTRFGDYLLVGIGNHGKVMIQNSNGDEMEKVSLQDLGTKLAEKVEIISIDAYEDQEKCTFFAVAYIQKSGLKDTEENRACFLRIYSTWIQPENLQSIVKPTLKTKAAQLDFKRKELELLGQQSKAFRLQYYPYHLYHVHIFKPNGTYVNVILLSGSDKAIHAYEPDEDNQTFIDIPTDKYFPEFSIKFKSVVTKMAMEYVQEESRRITICGFENGQLHIWLTNVLYSTSTPTPVSSFSPPLLKSNISQVPEFLDQQGISNILSEEGTQEETESYLVNYKKVHYYNGPISAIEFYYDDFMLNAVIASAASPTYLYMNVLEEEFEKGVTLGLSEGWDANLCILVADVDSDGQYEIIIGTYAASVLVYKLMEEDVWVIISEVKLNSPIFSLHYINGTIQATSKSGIHFIEYGTDRKNFTDYYLDKKRKESEEIDSEKEKEGETSQNYKELGDINDI